MASRILAASVKRPAWMAAIPAPSVGAGAAGESAAAAPGCCCAAEGPAARRTRRMSITWPPRKMDEVREYPRTGFQRREGHLSLRDATHSSAGDPRPPRVPRDARRPGDGRRRSGPARALDEGHARLPPDLDGAR